MKNWCTIITDKAVKKISNQAVPRYLLVMEKVDLNLNAKSNSFGHFLLTYSTEKDHHLLLLDTFYIKLRPLEKFQEKRSMILTNSTPVSSRK